MTRSTRFGCLLAIAIVVAFWIALVFVASAIAAPRRAAEFPAGPSSGAPHGTSQLLPRLTVALDAAVGGAGVEDRSPASDAPLPSVASAQPTNAPANVSVTGTATWYRAPSIHDAAAGPALRVGHWRGATVTVCASECVTVRLTDWCQCYRGTARERLIDLDSRSFARLAPLSTGVLRVTITRLPVGPATDSEDPR